MSGGLQDLGTLGGGVSAESYGTAINNLGHVTGYSDTDIGRTHAFLYDGNTMEDIGTLGDATAASYAFDINDLDHIAGRSTLASGGYFQAFLWDGNSMVNQDWGYDQNLPEAINESDETAGYAASQAGTPIYGIWFGGVSATDVGNLGKVSDTRVLGMNDAGSSVGFSTLNVVWSQRHAFWWDGSMHDMGTLASSGRPESVANDINNAGHIVGWSDSDTAGSAAFYYDGEMHDIGTINDSYQTIATAINELNHITGYYQTDTGGYRSFFYNGTTMTELPTLGGEYTWAQDINDSDWIAGVATTADGYSHAFLWSPQFPVRKHSAGIIIPN